MKVRKGIVSMAAAVLAMGSFAWADDSMSAASPASGAVQISSAVLAPGTTGQPLMAQASAPPEGALMQGLDKIGVGKPMEDWGLKASGWVEVGYDYDLTAPKNTTPARAVPPGDGILFDGGYKNAVMLNQAAITLERDVDPTKGKFDVGFLVQGGYGRDYAYTHSNGILDNHNKDGGGPADDIDLLQAYITVDAPIGNGIVFTAGKFVTLLGEEYINPTLNTFYSHSYSFSYGVPLTQTGITAAYTFNSQWSATVGLTRGWNQSTDDNNSAIDFLGQAVWTASDKLGVTFNLSEGPQATHDDGDYWTVAEVIPTYKLSSDVTLSADLLYADATHFADWWGAAVYGTYTLNSQFAPSVRAEYFGANKSGVITGAGGGSSINFYEVTAGVAITPLPDSNLFNSLTIRPEIREDWTQHAIFDGRKFAETDFAIDAYWKF